MVLAASGSSAISTLCTFRTRYIKDMFLFYFIDFSRYFLMSRSSTFICVHASMVVINLLSTNSSSSLGSHVIC
jgi:hypothetical protein